MANWYVWSGATGTGTGASWANAYTTIKAAAEAAGTAAGDNIWVAHDHAETTAATLTIASKNTAAAPGTIACVNRAGSVPPTAADLATTATLTTTGASPVSLTGGANGPTLWQGIIFSVGSGAVSSGLSIGTAATMVFTFKNCALRKLGTAANASAIVLQGKVILDNTTMQFGAAGDAVFLQCPRFEWLNTPAAIAGTPVPTTLWGISTSIPSAMFLIRGVDLSAYAGTLFGAMPSNGIHDVTYQNCKLAPGATASVQSSTPAAARINLVNCDSGATNYRNEKYTWGGTEFTETTIVHTGGASDGTTPVSWRIVTDGNARWQIPFESLPISTWSDTPGAHTVSIYGYWSNASPPNNDDIWIDVEYLGTAGFSVSSFAGSGKPTFLDSNAAIPTDASAWGGGATTTRFKMSVPITTAMKGPITAIVKAAKASSTFYIDPKIEVI